MTSDDNNTPEKPRYRRAFEEVLGEIQAVPEKDFVAITLDIPSVVISVIGACPNIRVYRAAIDETWRHFDMVLFDKLETYALALGHSQTMYDTATKTPPSLLPLVQSATKTRKLLLDEVNILIDFGLIDPNATSGLTGVNGYKDIAFHVLALANILAQRESKISVRTRISPTELAAAEVLAENLLCAVGEREQAPNTAAEAIRNRHAAFTLLVNAYEEVRAAIKYLRRKVGDADSIAPSLYTSHGIRKKKRAQSKLTEVESPNAAEIKTQPSVTSPPEGAIQASVTPLRVSNVPANSDAQELIALHGPFVGQG
jgi:hypothetical protein